MIAFGINIPVMEIIAVLHVLTIGLLVWMLRKVSE